MNVSNVPNWHRYVIGIIIAIGTVATAMSTGTVTVPPGLASAAPYAGLVALFITAGLPRWQLPTGEGAPPIVSPPANPPH